MIRSLKIIVLVKQVPVMSQVKFDVGRGKVDRSSADVEMNPFDLHALEAAVQIKEKAGGSILVISMGPNRAELVLRDALARGADSALLLRDRRFAGADTLATSYTLACAIKQFQDFHLIIAGEKTVDGDTGQVGPELAEHLNIPHVAHVFKLDVSDERLVAVCDMGGLSYTMEAAFPVLVTVTKDVNTPRLPAFRDKIKARQMKVEIKGAKELATAADAARFGVRGSPTRVHRVTIPSEENRKGRIFANAVDEAISEILEDVFKPFYQ